MATRKIPTPNRDLRGPRAAAVAGILFSLLYGTSYTIIQISIPAVSSDSSPISENEAGLITLGLSFLPFAGIAFLWFMGVIRERMGAMEDQFFSTLFLGSGILYIGLTFIAAAIGGGLLTALALNPDLMVDSDAYLLARSITHRITTVYSIRMAGMFMIVLGTIWVRTQIMPRWLAVITFVSAVLLLISVGFSHWLSLIFPAWVFLISLYILYLNFLFDKGDLDIEGINLER